MLWLEIALSVVAMMVIPASLAWVGWQLWKIVRDLFKKEGP